MNLHEIFSLVSLKNTQILIDKKNLNQIQVLGGILSRDFYKKLIIRGLGQLYLFVKIV